MRRLSFAANSLLLVLGLLLAACAPAAVPTPRPSVTSPTPAVAAPTSTPAMVVLPKGAEEKPRPGGVLIFAIAGDISTFDPHTHEIAIVSHTNLANYSNLVWFDPADMTRTKIIGDLATQWETSPDGTVYTFYLRKDAKFHDGQPVTAADVKFSLERIAFPPKGMPSPRQQDLYALKSVEAPDEYTVRLTLRYPSASFLPFLAGAAIVVVPKHLLEKEGNDALKKKPLGSGPFIFKSYDRGVAYEMVRNPSYYKPGRPYLDGVKAFVIRDLAASLSAFRTKRILMHPYSAGFITPAEQSVLLKEMGNQIISEPYFIPEVTDFFHLNNKWKPFQDVRVRQALAMAVNKQGLYDLLYQGVGQVSGPMPSGGPWALPKAELETYPGYEPDMKARIARAKELLAEAGYTGEKPLEVEVSTRIDRARYIEYVVSQLPRIGVNAKAKLMEPAAWQATLQAGTYQASAAGHSVSTSDPDSIIGTFYHSQGGRNYAHINDSKVDELFEKQARALDPQQRKEIVWEIQRILLRNAYWPAFGQKPYIGARYRSVRGNPIGPQTNYNVKYEDVWLAE